MRIDLKACKARKADDLSTMTSNDLHASTTTDERGRGKPELPYLYSIQKWAEGGWTGGFVPGVSLISAPNLEILRNTSSNTSLESAHKDGLNGRCHVTLGFTCKKINGRHFITFNDHGRSTKIRPKGRTRLRLFPKFGRVSRGPDTISGR